MKKALVIALVLLTVLVVGLVWADVRAREIAQATAQMKLRDALPQATEPAVEIESFPFIGRVLWNGRVERLRLGASELRSRGVTLRDVELEVTGLTIDRDKLFDTQEIAITAIDRAKLSASIAIDDVAKLAKVPVSVKNGRVEVRYGGKTYEGRILILNHLITLNVDGLPRMVVPLPEHAYLPCDPALEIVDDHLEIACSINALPPALAEVLR